MKSFHERYREALARAEAVGYWALTEEERAVIRKHQTREHRRRRHPGDGNSETIMRNRILRARSFGLTRDNTY